MKIGLQWVHREINFKEKLIFKNFMHKFFQLVTEDFDTNLKNLYFITESHFVNKRATLLVGWLSFNGARSREGHAAPGRM